MTTCYGRPTEMDGALMPVEGSHLGENVQFDLGELQGKRVVRFNKHNARQLYHAIEAAFYHAFGEEI